MKFIEKSAEPQSLTIWKRQNAQLPQNLKYGFAGFPHTEVLNALLSEQGWLCAYTMQQLAGGNGCHIEHVLPQSKYYKNQEDITYANMVACFPANGGDESYGYGAPFKKDHDPASGRIVSPLRRDCETRFKFSRNGEVEGLDEAAKSTIKLLRLNHLPLKEERADWIRREGLSKRASRPRNANSAEKLVRRLLTRNESEKFSPFCIAVAQIAERYAHSEREREKAMKARKIKP